MYKHVLYADLTEVFEMQKELDKKIGYVGTDRFEKKVLATIVELGEAVNELKGEGFKFWSKKPANREALKEELADVLHFLVSIGLEINKRERRVQIQLQGKDTTYNTLRIIDKLLELRKYHNLSVDTHGIYFIVLSEFFNLCYSCGFMPNDMIEAYKAKNAVNHQRQKDGY